MNGLEAILQSIGEEAQDKARSVRELAEVRAAEQLASARREAEALAETARRQANLQAEAILNRTAGTVALEKRKTLLATRQRLVDDVLAGVTRHLAELDAAAKSAWYEHLLTANAHGMEKIICCAADRALAEPLVARVNQARGWQLALASQDGAFSSGLVLDEGLVQVNLSTELLLRAKRPELVAEAARLLFGD